MTFCTNTTTTKIFPIEYFEDFANVSIFLDNYFCNGIIIVPTLFASLKKLKIYFYQKLRIILVQNIT